MQYRSFVTGLVILALVVFNYSCSSRNADSGRQKADINILDGFVMGIDLSYINQVEDYGGVYKESGQVTDVYKLFKNKGANLVRLRLWHNPLWTKEVYGEGTILYSAFDDVKKSIRRSKEQGIAVNLDFHYSDVWADPEHQTVPEAWKDITDIQVLCDSIYNYTYTVLDDLNQEGLMPEMVQIGNESNCGIMHTETPETFPALSVCEGNWVGFGKVLNAGIAAVRAIDKKAGTKTVIALHVADPKNLEWWFKDVIEKGGVTDFEVAGFSYYPHWHTEIPFQELPMAVKRLKDAINKEVMILETAYPYTLQNADAYPNIFGKDSAIDGYPISIEGQRSFLIDLTQNMIDAGAKGIMYWEPAWITSNMKDLWGQGSGWDNAALFDFTGNITTAADYLGYAYTSTK